MRKVIAGGVVLMLLAGCVQAQEAAAPPIAAEGSSAPAPTGMPEAPRPVMALAEIAGEWQVVEFAGYRPARVTHPSPGAFARFGPRGVGLRIECNWSGAPGTVQDRHFLPPANPEPQAQTAMGCGKEREDRDSAYFEFFTQNPSIEHIAGGRLRLIANGTELILERPEAIRLETLPKIADLAGEWRAEQFQLINHEGMRGIGLSEMQSRIVITPGSIAMSTCPAGAVAITYTADGRLARTGGADAAQVRSACDQFAKGAYAMPGLEPTRIAEVLAGSPKVYWGGKDRLALQTDEGLVLDLTRKPCTMLNQSDDHETTSLDPC